MNAAFSWISQYGYAALFGLLTLGIVGLPVPDETLLVFCGYLIWRRHLHPVATFLAGLGGSTCGITISYLLGRTCGHKVIYRYGRYVGLTLEHLNRAHRWFERLGTWLLAVGYFIPGVRHFTAVIAGTTELPWATFAIFAYSGAAVWVSTFLVLGYVVGDSWQQTSSTFHKYALIVVTVIAGSATIVWLVRRYRSRI